MRKLPGLLSQHMTFGTLSLHIRSSATMMLLSRKDNLAGDR